MKGKRVLITGASGFIGKNLVKRLCKENYVYAMVYPNEIGFSHKNVKEIKIDLLKNDLPGVDVDFIFHLAGCTNLREIQKNPEHAFNVNVNGMLRVLEWAKEKKIRKFVFMSSSAVYGNAKKLPVKEENELKPVSFYGLTKLIGEGMVDYYKWAYGFPAEIVRGFNIYGPGMDGGSLIRGVIRAVISGEKFRANDEEATRDFIFVDDAIEGLIKAAENGGLSVYNLGSGKETKIKKVIKEIYDLERK